jgi:hypothetical protein
MPYLLGTTAVLDTWTVVHMTAAKFLFYSSAKAGYMLALG